MPLAFRKVTGGLDLFIRLTPKSAKAAVSGTFVSDDKAYIQVKVREAPEDGRANKALIEFLADELDVPKSVLTLASGHTARLKTVRITGDSASLEARLKEWMGRKR